MFPFTLRSCRLWPAWLRAIRSSCSRVGQDRPRRHSGRGSRPSSLRFDQRDILLIDQRGTGLSQALRCRADESSPGTPVLEREEKASRECLASLDGDPRYYANGPAMEDLDEIRAALGYSQLNLWGGWSRRRARRSSTCGRIGARASGSPRWRRAVELAFSTSHRERRRARAGSAARRLRYGSGLLGSFHRSELILPIYCVASRPTPQP